MTPDKIILVYNADGGLFNALNDWAHKFFSPETYQCTLCRYTVGLKGMLFPWKEFIESLGCPAVFLHRAEFRQLYPTLDIRLPAIVVEVARQPRVLLSSEEIAEAGSLEGLIAATRRRLMELADNPVAQQQRLPR